MIRFEPRLKNSPGLQERLEAAGLDVMDYTRRGCYRIRLQPGDIEKHKAILSDVIADAYKENGQE